MGRATQSLCAGHVKRGRHVCGDLANYKVADISGTPRSDCVLASALRCNTFPAIGPGQLAYTYIGAMAWLCSSRIFRYCEPLLRNTSLPRSGHFSNAIASIFGPDLGITAWLVRFFQHPNRINVIGWLGNSFIDCVDFVAGKWKNALIGPKRSNGVRFGHSGIELRVVMRFVRQPVQTANKFRRAAGDLH
jgi:hypothetical protein